MATSARYNAIKEQLQKQGGTAKQNSGQTQRSDRYEAIRAKLKQNAFVTDVDEDYINSFVQDAKTFAQNTEQEYKNLNYQTAASQEAQSKRQAAMEDLTTRAGRVRTYLNANRSQLSSDSYNEAMSFLDSFKKFQTENLNAFRNAEAYFSRWESEDEYNSFVAEQAEYQKEYQEKLNLDTNAAAKELVQMEKDLQVYQVLRFATESQFMPDAKDVQAMAELQKKYGDVANLSTLIAQKREFLTAAEWIQRIARITNAEDFLESSKYVSTANEQERSTMDIILDHYDPTRSGWDDPLYEYVNGNKDAGAFISNQAAENYSGGGGLGAIFGRSTDSKTESQRMTEDEVAIFNYLYATEGKQAAHDYYYNYLQSDLNARQRAYDQKYWADYAKDDPFGSSVFSVVTSPLKGLSYIGQTGDYIANGKIDQNVGYNQFSYANSAIRDQVSKQIEESGKWGKAGSFLYQTGMSMGDFVMSTAVSGGNQAFALAIMGTGAAADTTITAKDRGLTDDQAFALGTVAGAAEILMEKIGLDALFDTKLLSGSAVKYILKNALAEGGEEVGTDLINTLADVLIAQDKSQWQMAIDAYVAEGKTENEAFGLALADKALELGLSGLGGALSGGVLGGSGAAVNAVQNKVLSNAQAVKDYGGAQQELVTKALELDPGNAFALKMKGILDSGKNLTGSQLNKLVQMNEAAVKQETPGSEAAQQGQTGEATAGDLAGGLDNTAQGGLVLPSDGNVISDHVQQNQSNTFQQEVQRQFERNNGYGKEAPNIYDIDEVFSAVKAAHSSGLITEERYSDIVDTLAFAQSDLVEGNITEDEYQGMLETAMRQVTQQSGRQMAPAVSATDPMVNVDRQTWQQAQRLAKALGRDIVFYNGVRGENGYYKDGTIYVNILADDPFAQVVSHELTHSLEGTRNYDRLKRFVFDQMARMNIDKAQARKAKADQYKSHGKDLKGEAEIDAEIVAEYVQTHLLTDEQAIMDLVAAERNVATRILDWLRNFARRIVGKKASRDRARLEHATRIYAKAIQESRNGKTGSGNVSLRSQGAAVDQSRGGELRQSREQTEADYREGRISDEEYDAAMDEYDRAEDERLGHSLEKYSFAGENANNANLDALAKAKEMQAAGVADETIRQQTGWYVGMDGKWRWEIDDSGMEYSSRGDFGLQERRPDYARYRELLDKANRHALELSDEALTHEETAELQKLKDIWGGTFRTAGRITEDALQTELLSDYVKHDALFEAYPQLRKTRLRFADMPEGTRGQYDPEQDVITVSQKLRGKPQDTLVHEIQHAIQRSEGFTSGSSLEYWMTRLEKDRRQEVELADKKYRDLFDSMPEALKNRVRAYNRANLDYDYDEAIAIEEELLEGEYAELFSAWMDADFERRNLRERYKAADLTEDARANYRNTAGEIEARNAADRRTMTQERRKNTPPDLGDEDMVFADSTYVSTQAIGRTVDNKPFVTVATDVLSGVPKKDWVQTIKNNLRRKYPKGVVVGRNNIRIDAQSRKELTYSKYMQWLKATDPQAYADKLRATDNSDEILMATTDWINEGLNHPRKDKIVQFARGNLLLRVGQNDYTAKVVVATETNGKMKLYDILDINKTQIVAKEMDAAITENPSPGAGRNTASISDDSVSQQRTEVNEKFVLYSDRDSAGNQLSAEQQEYFKDSEARDDGGNLLVLYHQTDGNFTIFDTRHPGAGTRDSGTPFGIFMKQSAGDIGLAGKKQMALYANITNPLRATNREDLARKLCDISERYASISDQHKKLDAEYREKFEQAKKAWVNYITEWRAANPGAGRNALNADPKFNELYDAEDNVVDEWTAVADRLSIQAKEVITEDLRKAGYDGVFLSEDVGSWGRKTDAIIALDPEQVKSITNKKPTSDRDIRYSLSGTVTDEQKRRALEGSYTTDEVEMQARKKGYPVLHGEQIVPFRTWVQTVDRGNYGLVTGMAPENKLLVSFHNKHDGGTADNVPIAYENLVPVPGTYQMTKEEFASLMESEPMDPGSSHLSEEDMREIEELYNQARGNEEKQALPIDFEKLPRKAQNYLNRAKRKLLRNIRKTLGVPQAAMQEHLQAVVDEIVGEYLNSGTVSDKKLGEFFDKAYAQGIVTDREFYDQYKHIKDHLRATAVTLSERDRADIADFNDFRKRQFGRLRIVNQGGLPVDTAYDELRSMAPELFPQDISHPADQLVHMAEVARSIEISKKTLDEYAGPERESFRAWARNDFDVAVGEIMGDLHAVRRFADERAAKAAREKAPATPKEAMEAYKNLKKARRIYERVAAKNLLTQHDEAQVSRLLRHEIELEHLNPEKDNIKGITAVYEAKVEYERLYKLITEYKRHIHGKLRTQADQYLKTANGWKDKKVGIAYARETMRRNIYDIVSDQSLAKEINEVYFEPVHDAEAKAVHLKDEYRNKVREMNLSRKVAKGNLVSEAHAVQLLGEAMDNIRILENTKGRMQHRDGKSLADWRGVVMKLWDENPHLDQEKIRGAVEQFRKIYDNLFEQMNKVRVENGYEPINYRSGYFPHFQPGEADGILAQFGRALGIDTQVMALPTTIAGLTHTFKPGIQWFGNAQERLGFNTAYDAVEGFDKYIEGAASVIFQTENIQRLRAFASQIRYRTSNEGIQEQVDAVYEDNRLTDEEKQVKIANIYEHGKFALANFVAELDEYTNLLANKKSRYDRTVEALMGRRSYAFLKWWESRVGANMIAGNISSALTNFIPLTQAGAQMDRFAILNGMWKTLGSYSTDDGLREMSSFLTNRKGSDPLVQNWSQKVSGKLSIPMETIDQFVSGSIVRGAYYQNLKRGMSESEAMHQADIFAAGVMADRSKGAMPTLMQASNPLFKMFTQFQLEVNNQFSEVFKDLPRNHRQQGILHFALVLFKYFLGAWLFNELYEWLVGRRPALDPIGLLIDAGKDFIDPDVGFGESVKNLGTNVLSELPFSSGLTLLGIETDGGRIPASSAVPDLTAIWDAATTEGWSAEKRWKELQDELNKLSYVMPPFGGNQISKIWKGTKAFIEGGSYSVDAQGNDILQYPVYRDDPWAALGSLFRATLLGKSSLPEAQEWVESGFDSLGAKETAVYQDMLDGGISQKEAFGLIQELGTAVETDSMTKDEAKRSILRNSDVSAEGKSIVYYGLLADDNERELMDALVDTNADPWEVVNTLMAMKDAGKLEGAEKTNAKYDAIIQAALTDEEKSVLVGSIIGTDIETEKGNLTQYAKFKVAIEGGMSVDEYLKFRKAGGDIDDYLDFSKAGLDTDDAVDISLALDELVPLDGKERVSEIQRWRTCVDTFSQTVSQMAALAGVMTDKQYAKVNVAYEYDVSPAEYVALWETLVKYGANGNGSLSNSEVTDAINSLRGLSRKQKAVLWQLSVSSKSAKNNPYSPEVGGQVLEALNIE